MYEDKNPFDDMETREELNNIFDEISSSQTNCPVEKYVNRENDVPTYMQYEDDWEDHFFTELGPSQVDSDSPIQEDLEDEDGHFDLEPPPPKITKFQDAISSIEAVQ